MKLERTLVLGVPREALWPLLADTDRLNRESDLPDVRYRYAPSPRGGSVLEASASKLGVAMTWQELPFDWSAPYFHNVERRFHGGPIRRFVGGVDLEADGQSSTRVRFWAEIEFAGFFGRLLARRAAVQGMERMVEVCRGFEAHILKRTPWSHGRRLNARADEKALAQGREALARAGFADELISALVAHLRTAPEEEVVGIKPYRMADRWGQDRRRVLEMFLESVQAGLTELRWTVICPACRGARFEANRLHAVRREAACESCAVDFTNEFDRTVEARFDVHPRVRMARKLRFCAGGPGNTPHRTLQLRVAPGAPRSVLARFEPGVYRLRSPHSRAHAELRVDETASPRGEIAVEISEDGVFADAEVVKAGEMTLRVQNRAHEESLLQADRAKWDSEAVSAAEVSTVQRFRDLFADEAIETGQEMTIGRLAFLFSDLEGSTELYERVGDVPAFALVKAHFDFMKERISRRRGAIVKTMGDAVMAVFADPADALRAAAEVQQDAMAGLRQASGAPKFRLKLGMHAGPCVVVGANGIVDYFGTTVNLAQRVQSSAAAGEVMLCTSVFEEAGGLEIFDTGGWRVSREDLTLRGFSRPIAVVRCRALEPTVG